MLVGVRISALTGPVAVGLFLAGCGGGSGSTRYSRPAFESCLQQNGATTFSFAQLERGMGEAAAQTLRSIAPNVVGIRFPSKEFATVAFASDAAGANKIYAAFNRLVSNSTSLNTGKLARSGNIVILINQRVTEGVQKTIQDCERSAALTGGGSARGSISIKAIT